MAGEVGHVVYAARLLTYLKDSVHDPQYWVGTLFPDIRHLGVLSRHRTHPAGVTLHTMLGTSDFQTGLRVHAWVDMMREEFLRSQHIKEYLPWHPFVPHALKLVEDEFLYAHFDDWDLIHHLLNKIYDDELFYVHSRQHVDAWHRVLQAYLKQPPTDASRYELALSIGLSEASAHELNTVVHVLLTDQRTTTLLNRFLHHFESLLH